ncbi:MAG: hypothetical protein LBU89_07605 [Fibromonadaceae bacterium]|jgi:hypothetical protein|nr:hypothetical protein [Fibromonadaceae bacterium]
MPATTGTTITGGDLKLIANKAVANIGEILLAANAFALGVESTGMSEGDSTQVFVAGSAPDAKAFNAKDNNYMTDNGGEHAWVPLTLSQHMKLTFRIPPQKFEKLTPDSMAALYKPYVSKVASKIIKDTFAKVTATAFKSSINAGPVKDFNKTIVSNAETALAKLVGQGSDRNLILNMDYYDALRDSLTGIYATPTNNEVLRNGTIPGLSGFANIIRTSAIESATGNGQLIGLATNMSGVALSVAAVKQIPQFDGEVEVAVEEHTKIPLTFSVDYDKDTRSYVATVEALYGIAVIDEKGILRLTSGAAA